VRKDKGKEEGRYGGEHGKKKGGGIDERRWMREKRIKEG
jgi:hypothetical protein